MMQIIGPGRTIYSPGSRYNKTQDGSGDVLIEALAKAVL
jgi:hypothetical protein